jgi:hypothetical protein
MRYRQVTDDFRPPSRRTSRYIEGAVEVVPEVPVTTEDVKLSLTIMAHPKRKEWAEQLSSELSCDITWDRFNDRHDTGFRAIKAYDPEATHHLVVQDDVILCDNFLQIVEEACRYPSANAPIGLYYGSKGSKSSAHAKAAIAAENNNASWVVRKGPVWGPGIIYPVASILDLMKFFRNSKVDNYDRRVMRYYQSIGEDCWYTFPSLVEHRHENNPSLCGHNKPNRTARSFLKPQMALEISWSGPVVKAI